MTENLQPGQHLSPDQLSAFAENVLPQHERLATLTHLADCPDCRQVVFLAQQADLAFSAAPAPDVTPRRGWFTLPQIFGAATAALACSIILALIIHQRHTGTPTMPAVTTAKVDQPPVPVLAPPTPISTLSTTPAAPLLANPAQLSEEAHTSLSSPAGPALKPIPQPSRLAETRSVGAVGAGMSSGNVTESKQQDKAIDVHSVPSANAYAALPPKAPAVIPSAMPAPPPPPPPPPAPALRMREANSDSAKSKKDFSTAETVTVTGAAPLLDGTAEVAADNLSMSSIQDLPLSGRAAMSQTAAKPAPQRPIQLPSKKPAVSVLTSAGRTLALDVTGALFLSTDLGKHWTAVTPQWPGKAAQLTYAATPARLYLQQHAQQQTQNQSNNSINGNVANNGLSQQQAPIPAAGFDLTTATGAVWHSADGLTWHPK